MFIHSQQAFCHSSLSVTPLICTVIRPLFHTLLQISTSPIALLLSGPLGKQNKQNLYPTDDKTKLNKNFMFKVVEYE